MVWGSDPRSTSLSAVFWLVAHAAIAHEGVAEWVAFMTANAGASGIQHIIGSLLVKCIDTWLYLCGRKFRRADVSWLISPTGPSDRIGEHWYGQLAANEGLTVTLSREAGLVPCFNDLAGPSFDPNAVCWQVRDFYEHTARYSLEAWSEVTIPMRLFLWGLVTFASRRMQQLNFPVSSLELASGMSSEVIELTEAGGSASTLAGCAG